MKDGDSRLKFARKRAATVSLVAMKGAIMRVSIAEDRKVTLPVAGGQRFSLYYVREEQTGSNKLRT